MIDQHSHPTTQINTDQPSECIINIDLYVHKANSAIRFVAEFVLIPFRARNYDWFSNAVQIFQ
jgi:hypothetical protein